MPGISYAFGHFVLDVERKTLSKDGAAVEIGYRCLLLLETLLLAEGQAVSKSKLMEAAWQASQMEDSNLAVQIAALRKCLGSTTEGNSWIATVHRVGYQFAGYRAVTKIAVECDVALGGSLVGDKQLVAVLPFDNLSGSEQHEYLCEVFTREIIFELARWRRFVVRPHGMAPRYDRSVIPVQQIAHELGVRYLIEGSIWVLGDRVHVTVQLIDAMTPSLIWGSKFDRYIADCFLIQDQVIQMIVSTMVGRVEVASAERVVHKPTASLLAHEYVLRGNALNWNDPVKAAEATQLFARAVAMDPGSGFAHSMLAIMLRRNWLDDWTQSDATQVEAYRLARRAIELDDGESTCYAMLSSICLSRRLFDQALQNGYRAIEINPNNQWNVANLGCILARVGEAREAVSCFVRARERDSYLNPPWYWSGLGLAYMMLHRFEDALVAFERATTRSYWIAAMMAGCHACLVDEENVSHRASECINLRPDFSIARRVAREQFKYESDAIHLSRCLSLAHLPE